MSSVAPDIHFDPHPVAPQRRFKRKEYDALAALDFFEDEKLELLDGVIYEKVAEGPLHSKPILRLTMLLAPALVGRADVGVQLPFAASDYSEPEPDLFIVPRDDDNEDHPSRAFCVIEVAVTSQRRDRMKVRIYADNGVPQLILIDVPRREARVYREPRDGEYGRIETLREGQRLVIDAFPDVGFDLAEVLPKAPSQAG